MKIELVNSIPDHGLVCFFVLQNAKLPKELKHLLKGISKKRFVGKSGETFFAQERENGRAGGKVKHIFVVGLGKKEEFRTDLLRCAAGSALRHAATLKMNEFSIVVSGSLEENERSSQVQAIVEGAILSSYKCTEFKSSKEDQFFVEKLQVISTSKSNLKGAIEKGTILANAQNYVRRINEWPANIASPEKIAHEARKLAKENGLEITVLNRDQIAKKGMGGIIGVSQGSVQEPKFIILEYNKGKALPLYSIVGKGVVFDSGGINIKPSKGMYEMKYDKTGAMNVLGIFKAVSALGLKIRLLGLMPMVENLPSGSAQCPGDIIKAYNGKTIEVLDTDAEGRLILADALSYAAEQKPEYIIDMATLTGAIIVALGRYAIGMFATDDHLAEILSKAGNQTHERVWRMPLWPEHLEVMKSDFADLKNISEIGEAGSTTAAAFLKEFVGDVKWAHLDIAAVDLIRPPHPYMEKGASGTGVRLITCALENLAAKK